MQIEMVQLCHFFLLLSTVTYSFFNMYSSKIVFIIFQIRIYLKVHLLAHAFFLVYIGIYEKIGDDEYVLRSGRYKKMWILSV